ncbi:Asp23/Gls24 family envelope stress response protein [Ruminococcaceae bacterium OttesenSCG-928-I18]|nr:Asp23/Gls24 family envelope stress response protein [Ruminococcaceae bacterium OttesenSCG-928-I18]
MAEMNMNTAGKQEFEPIPQNVKVDDKVVKKLAGDAVLGIDGLLSVKGGGLAGFFSEGEDPSKGMNIDLLENDEVAISMKVVTESGKNIPKIAKEIEENITAAIQNNVGLRVTSINVEVADTMTREEYDSQADMRGEEAKPIEDAPESKLS